MLRPSVALLALGLVLASAAPALAHPTDLPRQDRGGWRAFDAAAVPTRARRHRGAHRARHARRAPKHRAKAVRQSRAIPAPLYALVSAAAQVAGVPIAIAHAVVRVESRYNPLARGRAGELGLMQIKPATARGLGFRGAASGLFDPATNLRWGMRYLRLALARGGPGCAGVSLYQSGIYARPRCSAYG
ncbi:MAG: transglycosylase SLT domain-containing protein, partial [Alphaproteobacteria bacterium]|nr:transglycosylase SLT domain-containing protein [Alphaproteobacteria bacterium]